MDYRKDNLLNLLYDIHSRCYTARNVMIKVLHDQGAYLSEDVINTMTSLNEFLKNLEQDVYSLYTRHLDIRNAKLFDQNKNEPPAER